MQNAQAALRSLRKFLAPAAAVRRGHSFRKKCTYTSALHYAHWAAGGLRPVSDIPLHLQFCRGGSQHAGFSGSVEAPVAVDPVKANLFAEQVSASSTLEDTIAQEKSKVSEPNTIEDSNTWVKSREMNSPQLHLELPERLNRLEDMIEQHGRSLTSLSSQLEGQTQLFASILEDVNLLKAEPGSKAQCWSPSSHGKAVLDSLEISDVSASSTTQHSAAPWPEWTSFLQHLKGLPFFKESVEVAELGGSMAFDDHTTVKRMLAKFSQAYEYIFVTLSVTHLRVLAEHGCPNDDRRTVASVKRLRNQFHIEEKSNSLNATAKLSDVMRLVYTIAEVAKKYGTPDNVKLSILHLLEEIMCMTSDRKHDNIVHLEIFKDSGSVLDNRQNVEFKIGVEGSSSSRDVEMLSRSDKWKCPRCSRMNRQSKSKCVECSFQRLERNALGVASAMQKSNLLSANRNDTKVSVSGEDTKEAAKKWIEKPILDNDRQAATSEGSLGQSLVDVPRRLLAVPEQQEVQKPTLSEEDEKKLGGAGLRDESDADEHSDIFDDIFDCDGTSSSIAEQEPSKKCSLSDLVWQDRKAFSSPRREREQGAATATDDHERKRARPSGGKGHKHDDLDVTTRRMSYGADRDESDMEAEDTDIRPHRSGGGRTNAGSSMGSKRNQPYNYKVGVGGKGFADSTHGDYRSRTKGRQQHNREEDSDAASEDGRRYFSGKTYGNERPRYRERNPGGYSDNESEERSSRAERGGGFERKRR